jgi:hypothetical protein
MAAGDEVLVVFFDVAVPTTIAQDEILIRHH